MTPKLISPAASLAITLEEAKKNLKITSSSQDALVTAWIRGLTKNAEKFMRRSILHQDWLLTLDRFDGAIELPMPPLVSVAHVKYFDENDVQQVLHPDDYTVDTASETGYIVPAPGAAWPTTYSRINAVEVRYTCGYGPDATYVPDDLKLYLLSKLAEMFDPPSGNAPPTGKPYAVSFIDSFLDDYRIY